MPDVKGRKPLPRNIRLVTGNTTKRAIDPDIPDPEVVVDVPEPPDRLSIPAREHWLEFAEQLAKMRVLTDADTAALCMLCESYAVYWEAIDGVQKYGIISITPNKYLQRSEYLNTAFRAMDACLKILTEFGLTPSSRMRVRT